MKRSGRFAAFSIGFLIGMLFLLAAIAGAGFWAYKNLTLDQVGIQFGEGGERGDLSKMSIESLSKEMMRIYGLQDTYTIAEFEKDYGVDVSELMGISLNEDFKSSPLLTIFSDDGLNKLFARTKISAILGFFPDLFGQEVYEVIGSHPIQDLFSEGGISSVLTDVKLGGLLGGYAYDAESGRYQPKDAENMTLVDYAVNVDMGRFLSALEQNADLLSEIKSGSLKEIGEIQLRSLIEGIDQILQDKTFSDLINAENQLDFQQLTAGIYVGNLLGYFRGECKNTAPHAHDDNCEYFWFTDEQLTVAVENKAQEALSNVPLSDFLNGDFDLSASFGGLHIGDLLGYELREDGWYDVKNETPIKVDAVTNSLSDVKITDLLEGSFRPEEIFRDNKIGELLGYEQHEDGWYQKSENDTLTKVDPFLSTIADISFSDLLSGNLEIDRMFEDLYFGDFLKYYHGECRITDPSHQHGQHCEYQWYSDKDLTTPVQEADNTISNINVGLLMSGEFRSEEWIGELTLKDIVDIPENSPLLQSLKDTKINQLSEKINTLSVADILGLEKYDASRVDQPNAEYEGQFGKYENGVFLPEIPLIQSIADLTLLQMNGESLQERILTLKLKDILKIESTTGILAALADTRISELETEIGNLKIGTVLNLELYDSSKASNADPKYENLYGTYDSDNRFHPESGILQKLSVLSISALNGNKLQEILMDSTLQEIGIDTEGNVLLKELGNVRISDLSEEINRIPLGKLLNLYEKDGTWYTDPNCMTPSTGINAAIAPLTIRDIGDGKLTDVVNGMKLGDLLDLGDQTTGILKLLKDTPLSELGGEIEAMEFGSVMGYEKFKKDKWETDGEAVPADGADLENGNFVWLLSQNGSYQQATGITEALADQKVNDLQAETVMNKIQQMPVSEFFGEDTTGSGVLGLLLSKNQNATLSSLPQDMTNAVTSATIGELTENGLLNFPADTEENLNKIFRGESWKNMPLTNLITALVEIAAQSVA